MKLLALLMMTTVMSFSASSLLAGDRCSPTGSEAEKRTEAGPDLENPTPVDNKDQRGN
jgi:hypothetical protein